MPEALEETLRRLKEERAEADRRYNEALTALDRTLAPAPDLPPPPSAYDEHQITPLNEAWNILPAPPALSGLAGRLKGLVWRVVAPYLERQHAFNSKLVDHLNRNVAAHRDARRSAEELIRALREHLARQGEIQSRLMLLLQQVTAYVDTRDRDAAGGALVLNAAISALAEDFDKRWESMRVRAHGLDARAAAIETGLGDLGASLGVTHQTALAVRRELERRGVPAADGGTPAEPAGARPPAPEQDTFGGGLDAYKYVGFEEQFRGSQADIRARLESYLPLFDTAPGDVLDIGCGRGEFLDLLTARGVRARGVDLNAAMVDVCRERGLEVERADAVGYLSRLEDGTLGGMFAAQVVEHLQPAYLLHLLELASQKLAPGGVLVLETINPACWVAFFESYIRDITHVRPLHPDTLRYFVTVSGFTSARIEYRSPVPDEDRLQPVAAAGGDSSRDLVAAFNDAVEKLNARMFTSMDYAVIARKTS